MAVFLSTYQNRIDKKGRVSVPAAFRAILGAEAPGIVVFRSLQLDALEACSVQHLELLSDSLETLDLPAATLELIETAIFGGSQLLPFDGEGRVILPEIFLQAAQIFDEVAFVGRRKTFQLWQPARFAEYEASAREQARAQDLSLSKIITQAAARAAARKDGV